MLGGVRSSLRKLVQLLRVLRQAASLMALRGGVVVEMVVLSGRGHVAQ